MKSKLTIALITILIIVVLVISKNKLNAMNVEKKQTGNGSKLKILDVQTIRSDSQGDGRYGSTRSGHKHMGIDLVAQVNEDIYSPVAGEVKKIGLAYAGDNRYNSFHIAMDSGLTLKLLYVKPLFKVGDRVNAGQVIARSQNIAAKYGGGMINHVHVELISNGFNIDPTNFFI